MNSEEMRCLGGLQGALASPRDGMHPADFRASCRAPSGGRFYVASSLPSSSEIRSGWDVARVPDVSFQEAGDPSGIIPAVPGRRRIISSPRLDVQGFLSLFFWAKL